MTEVRQRIINITQTGSDISRVLVLAIKAVARQLPANAFIASIAVEHIHGHIHTVRMSAHIITSEEL